MMGPCLKLGLALTLDIAASEPSENLHPVCWMGKAVAAAERRADALKGPAARRRAGVLTAVGLPAGVYFISRGILRKSPRPFRDVVEAAMLFTALAARSLGEAGRSVDSGLREGKEEGRKRVSRMVGRDTDGLDEDGIIRAAVESVAENTNDAVVAPMFYGLIGGAPLALAYRMVNTLDSMVGYRNERYRDFGWAAARLDDIAGYVPARVTALAVAAASPLMGADGLASLVTWRRDAKGHASPNAGVCESAFAGALGVSLGGNATYGGQERPAHRMGVAGRKPARGDIGRAVSLMYGATVVAYLTGSLARGLIRAGAAGMKYRSSGAAARAPGGLLGGRRQA